MASNKDEVDEIPNIRMINELNDSLYKHLSDLNIIQISNWIKQKR
jgi:hypothetical protein